MKLTAEETLQGLLDLLNARYMACKLKPGAEEFLREAGRRGFRLVIGTASDRKAVEAILARHGLLDLFLDIITTGETGLDKKDPTFYWTALERLGSASGRALRHFDHGHPRLDRRSRSGGRWPVKTGHNE